METQKNEFLGTERIGKLMAKFTIPCVIALLVAAMYNIVDQLFISNADYLGSYGLAANSVVYPLTVTALALAMGIGDGCCAFTSINLGAKGYENVHKGIGNAIVSVSALGIILMIIFLVFKGPIITAFGGAVSEETFVMAKEYLTWISIGIPFYMFSQAMNAVIRADGSPGFSMVMLCTGAAINLVLDPLCIYVFRWGMAGAAIATITGQIVSAIMAICYFRKLKTARLTKESFKLNFRLLKQMVTLGLTSFLSQISTVFSIWAVLGMAAIYGQKDPIFSMAEYAHIPAAVIGLVMKFFQIVISIAVGLGTGIISIVGFNVGAKKFDRVREVMWKLFMVEFIVGLIFSTIFLIFPNQILTVFGAANESQYYIDFAVKATRLYLCVLFFSCANKGTSICMQAMGDVKTASILAMLREVVFGVGLPLLLPLFMGIDGTLWFMCIADVLTFIPTIIVMLVKNKKLKQAIPEMQVQTVPAE